MNTPITDSAELLANLFENVQVMMRQFSVTPGSDASQTNA